MMTDDEKTLLGNAIAALVKAEAAVEEATKTGRTHQDWRQAMSNTHDLLVRARVAVRAALQSGGG